MKMRKKSKGLLSCCIIMCMVMMFGLVSCSKAQEEISVDAEQLAGDLFTKITYEDKLAQVEQDVAVNNLFDCADVKIKECYVYESSRATAEEIAVFVCENGEEAQKMREVLETRVEEQKESYEDYVHEELVKLDKAVIEIKGNYAVLVVANDSEGVKNILAEYLK